MRGNITRRGKNSWQLRFDVAPVNGKRQRRIVTVRGSFADARKELTRLLAARDTGMLPLPTAATVGEYVRSWLDTATGRSPKTKERYGELIRWQISPHLGDVPLQKLSPEMIRHWHAALIEKVSARTTGHAHRLLRQVLATAVKDGKLARNVADVHRPPKVKRSEVEILTIEEIGAVQDALRDHSLAPIVGLALGSGLRRGELLALQWGDIDLNGAVLQVKRSLEETAAGLRFKEPKSDAGWRTITLSPPTVAMLRAYRVDQMQFRLAVGAGALKDDTLVFTDFNGQPLKPHTVSRAWRRVVDAKGLPKVTFHSLRHSHASVLIREGLDVLTVSKRLGHAKPSVTLDVYGHLMGGADAACAIAIGKVLK